MLADARPNPGGGGGGGKANRVPELKGRLENPESRDMLSRLLAEILPSVLDDKEAVAELRTQACADLAEEIAQLISERVPRSAIVPMTRFREWAEEAGLTGGTGSPLLVAMIAQTIENEQPPEARNLGARLVAIG